MQLKKYRDGTERYCSPQETLKRIKPFLSDMGITRVANLTGLDDIGIPVVGVYRPNSKSLSVSQGKGHSLDAAKVSGIMESIEGYHAENIDLNIIQGSYLSMHNASKNIVKIDDLPKSCERTFLENSKTRWVPCKRIDNSKITWIPHELVHAEFTVPVPEDHGYFIADSNGLASGNTLLEAINHGLYEVIERDCLALWQLTPTKINANKRIDLDSITDIFLKSILKKLTIKNIHIGIWDITNDLKIPTFLCKIISDKNTGIRPAYGSGTHLNKNIALSRAITEAAQSRLTFISGARDDQYNEVYEGEISDSVYNSWLSELSNINKHNYTSFDKIPLINFEYLEEDQNHVLSQLNKMNLKDAYYADLTKDKYNINVVKVIVPGLEGVTYPDRRLLGTRALKLYDKYGVGACEMT